MIAFAAFLLLAFVPTYVGAQVYGYTIHFSKFSCVGKPDGLAEIGCDGMIRCVGGRNVTTLCGFYQFFDRDTMECKDTHYNTSGCADHDYCRDKADGTYADIDNNCHTYYVCNGHLFYGHQYCPSGLVFNEELGICDWIGNVPFPCGSLHHATVSPALG